ncbi:threonine-phosphate decarboxylase [mine drainage metagenome]|uniref:Threonine-phosphate decarboxylase n=1 Tax=mine drainage metagenome TaxID=410659 RepID=A0A1J5R122_9ZZZZ
MAVICNPNNPTGHVFPPELLLDALQRLTSHQGWLIVDEAFMDATPESSLAAFTGQPGLIVLRSLGKFFGLAGARIGFTLAWPELLERLEASLGPWPIGGPARLAARLALQDTAWQADTRQQLQDNAARLRTLLTKHGLPPRGGSALFQWVVAPHAATIHERLARRGILTRLFTEPASLRFGLPGTEQEWVRLAKALED